jgi:uncharacterized protein
MSKWFLLPALLAPLLSNSVEAHFLWRVDGDQPSYLYGTIHTSDPQVREIPAAVLQALESSSSFHPELEFSPENLGHITAAIFAGGSGGDLAVDLPPETWARVVRQGEALGLPSFLLRRVPVQFLPVLFASPPEAEFDRIIDVQVYQKARDRGLRIHALETVDEQMAVFRQLSPEDAKAFLQESLSEAEKDYPTMRRTIELYASGNLSALESFLREEFARYPVDGLEEALLNQRNRTMADRLEPYLSTGGAFAAIGAGHFPGAKGIVALLEERGFSVTPIPLRPAVEADAPPQRQ